MRLAGQIIGMFATAALVSSFQCRRERTIACFWTVSAALFVAHYLMLGEISGAVMESALLVRNLLDNAVRYSPRGSQVDITLNAREFRVRDNGPGISPQALSRIGERFYRPPGQEAPGSGLGLSIVRRIASLHGMQVDFANARDGGFEARVYW